MIILKYLLSCTVWEIQHSICLKTLYYATVRLLPIFRLALPPPDGWVLYNDLRKMSMDGQGIPNGVGVETLPKISPGWVERSAHERYRQTTDGRAIAYSECKREFTFAKNWVPVNLKVTLVVWSLSKSYTSGNLARIAIHEWTRTHQEMRLQTSTFYDDMARTYFKILKKRTYFV